MKEVSSMPLSPDPYALRKLVVIAICASLSVVLGIVEALIPFAVTIPGAKLGLGNILVLTCLVCLGQGCPVAYCFKDTADSLYTRKLLDLPVQYVRGAGKLSGDVCHA